MSILTLIKKYILFVVILSSLSSPPQQLKRCTTFKNLTLSCFKKFKKQIKPKKKKFIRPDSLNDMPETDSTSDSDDYWYIQLKPFLFL